MITTFVALYLLAFHDLFDDFGSICGASPGCGGLACGASAVAIGVTVGMAWLWPRRGEKVTAELAEVVRWWQSGNSRRYVQVS